MSYRQIIQGILDTYPDSKYIEIGLCPSKGEAIFASINAKYKVALCQMPPSEQIKSITNDNCVYYRMSSGYFFSKVNAPDIRFDVAFINGSYDCAQICGIVETILVHLAFDGVIVIPVGVLNGITQSELDTNQKAIATLSCHSELFVFTLDYDGNCDCAIIAKAEVYSILSNSETPINNDNSIEKLNIKSPEYLNTFLMCRKYKERLNGYSLYVENVDNYIKDCSRDYYLNEIPEISVVENGIILPAKTNDDVIFKIYGGVYDAEGNFIAGLSPYRYNDDNSGDFSLHQTDYGAAQLWKLLDSHSGNYTVSNEITHIKETVVFGGILWWHYGHALVESLSRMWYFLEHNNCGYRYAFISFEDPQILDFHIILGLREEDIIIIKEPIRFDSVIVPEQSHYLLGGFNDKAIKIYNTIRDSVKPACYDKVYLTRMQMGDILNEEYFVNHYRSLGYEIISMEQLPIKEQVAIMAGAKEIVCISGTLHHQILLCRNGVNVTVLNKCKISLLSHYWINQARLAKCTFIDASANLLPNVHGGGISIFMPNAYWKRYTNNYGYSFQEDENLSMDDFVIEYIGRWAKATANDPKILRMVLMLFETSPPLSNLVIDLNRYLLNNEFDYFTKKKLIRDLKTVFVFP